MTYKRILTIQDISCVGQCSLTVALPILSACGLETAILPSAVLSTHTAGFSGYTFRDLTDDMPSIKDHWVKENIKFDGIYTGYLGSTQQIDYVIPNITEAAFLTGIEYKEKYDREYIDSILNKFSEMGVKNVIFTGISYEEGKTGVVVYEDGNYSYYQHDFLPNSCHGTGDIYASAFVGALTGGKSAYEAAKIAADYTVECIKATAEEENHWYGAKFEPVLGKLIEMLR